MNWIQGSQFRLWASLFFVPSAYPADLKTTENYDKEFLLGRSTRFAQNKKLTAYWDGSRIWPDPMRLVRMVKKVLGLSGVKLGF